MNSIIYKRDNSYISQNLSEIRGHKNMWQLILKAQNKLDTKAWYKYYKKKIINQYPYEHISKNPHLLQIATI